MRKSVKVRMLCLAVAFAALSGVIVSAAVSGSPYETLKKAALDAVTYRNVTVETHMTASVDGVIKQEEKSFFISGDNSSLSYSFDENGERDGYEYTAARLTVYPSYVTGNGVRWYNASVHPAYDSSRYAGGFGMISPEQRDSAEMRFMELLADLLVGDLKNNVTMSSSGGVRHISGALSESQVPEIVKAGVDVLAGQSGRYYYSSRDVSFDGREYVYETISGNRDVKNVTVWKKTVRPITPEDTKAIEDGTFYENNEFYGYTYIGGQDYIVVTPEEVVSEYTAPFTRADFEGSDPLNIPMESLTIDYARGDADVDGDGNLLSFEVTGSATFTDIFGETSVLEISAGALFTDIGVSDPVCPIPGAEELLTPEFILNLTGSEYGHVFFTLNPDGSVNEDSVTAEFDRWLYETGGEAAGTAENIGNSEGGYDPGTGEPYQDI